MQVLEAVNVRIPEGLHLRSAARLVQLIQRFKSRVAVQRGETRVDARSILGLLGLSARQGSQLIFYFEGEDALAAAWAVRDFFIHHGSRLD